MHSFAFLGTSVVSSYEVDTCQFWGMNMASIPTKRIFSLTSNSYWEIDSNYCLNQLFLALSSSSLVATYPAVFFYALSIELRRSLALDPAVILFTAKSVSSSEVSTSIAEDIKYCTTKPRTSVAFIFLRRSFPSLWHVRTKRSTKLFIFMSCCISLYMESKYSPIPV